MARRPGRRHPRAAGGARLHGRPRAAARSGVERAARRGDREGPRRGGDRLPGARPTSTASPSARRTSTPPAGGSRPTTRSAATVITVVSAYVHSGEVGTPKQDEKFRFLDAMEARLPELVDAQPARGRRRRPQRRATGRLDIRNWRGNQKASGFLPEERAYWDRIVGAEDDAGYNAGARARLGRRRPPCRRRGRRPVHLVVVARPGVRQRHRLADRLPPRIARARRARGGLRGRQGATPATSDGRTTRPWSSTTRCDPSQPRTLSIDRKHHDRQGPHLLRHPAERRLPAHRQLHRRRAAVARPAGRLRRHLLHRRPARDHGAAGPEGAAAADPHPRRAVHRRRDRPRAVHDVRAVAGARARASSRGC